MVYVKKVAIQGTALLTLAAVSLWLVSQYGPSTNSKPLLKSLSASEITQKVADCKLASRENDNSKTNPSAQDFATKERCLAEIAVISFRDGKLALFNDSLTEVAGKNLSGFMYCHTALHKAGSQLFKDVVDFSDFFKGGVNKEGICDNGLIHGYFDALGVDNSFSFAKWLEISNKCSVFKDNQDVAKMIKTVCGDGAGHAIWQGTRDYELSFSGCLSLNDTLLRQSCIAGVMMQIPKDDADGKKSYFSYQELDKRWFEVCNSFDKVISMQNTAELFEGLTGFETSICGAMGGQNYSVGNSIDLLFQNEKDAFYLERSIAKGMQFCQSFERVDDQMGCKREYAVQGRFAVGFDKDLQTKYCSFFPTKELQRTCLQFDGWCGTQRSEECNRVQ